MDEGEIVQVCISQQGSSETAVDVTVRTRAQTAIGMTVSSPLYLFHETVKSFTNLDYKLRTGICKHAYMHFFHYLTPDGVDFETKLGVLSLEPPATRVCCDIQTLTDNEQESTESFEVVILQTPEGVDSSLDSTVVSITDRNCCKL